MVWKENAFVLTVTFLAKATVVSNGIAFVLTVTFLAKATVVSNGNNVRFDGYLFGGGNCRLGKLGFAVCLFRWRKIYNLGIFFQFQAYT